MFAKDIMSMAPVAVTPETTARGAAPVMPNKRISPLPVFTPMDLVMDSDEVNDATA